MQRPSSARATQTKTYFDLRDSNISENEEVHPPFLLDNSNLRATRRSFNGRSDWNESSALLSILGDTTDFATYEWSTTTTVKPRAEIADAQLRFSGIGILDKYLSSWLRYGTQREIVDDAERPLIITEIDDGVKIPPAGKEDSVSSCGVLRNLYICIASFIDRNSSSAHNAVKSDAHQLAEEGNVIPTASKIKRPIETTPKHLLRMKSRTNREISLSVETCEDIITTAESPTKEADDSSDELLSDDTGFKIFNESFWSNPEQNQTSLSSACRYEERFHFELIVQVERLKFSQHSDFVAEENILSQICGLNESYRHSLESEDIHRSVISLILTLQKIRSDTKGIHSLDAGLFEAFKSTSNDVIRGSDSLNKIYSQIEEKWKELQSARDSSGIDCTGAYLDVVQTSESEIARDGQRLKEVISSLKPKLIETNNDDLYNCLEQVERSLSSSKYLSQVLHIESSEPLDIGLKREEKKRRKKIASEKYFVRLVVNDNPVGRSCQACLNWPSYSVAINHRFRCTLSRMPKDVCVQICRVPRGFLPAQVVCSCYINIPEIEIGMPDRIISQPELPIKPKCCVQWYMFSDHKSGATRLKGAVLVSSDVTVHRSSSSHGSSIGFVEGNVKRNISFSKKLVRNSQFTKESNGLIESKVEVHYPLIEQEGALNCIPNLQHALSFKFPSTIAPFYDKSKFKEPMRHTLIKKRQIGKDSVPSPIPIDEILVQEDENFRLLTRQDVESLVEVRSRYLSTSSLFCGILIQPVPFLLGLCTKCHK